MSQGAVGWWIVGMFVLVFFIGPLVGIFMAYWVRGPARKEFDDLGARVSDVKKAVRDALLPPEKP